MSVDPAFQKVLDELAALKQGVAYLAEGKQLVAGLRINALTGAGPMKAGAFTSPIRSSVAASRAARFRSQTEPA